MLTLPTLEQVGGIVGAVTISGLFIVAYGFVTYHARRFANLRWPSRADIAQREAEMAARAWCDAYDTLVTRIAERDARCEVCRAEMQQANAAHAAKLDKLQRALRRRGLTDSSEVPKT